MKYYLLVEQRDLIIEALLRYASDIEKAAKDRAPEREVSEVVESRIQGCRHLALLFEIKESER